MNKLHFSYTNSTKSDCFNSSGNVFLIKETMIRLVKKGK